MSIHFLQSHDLLQRDATARPQSFDRDALTIDAVIASSSPVKRRDQRGEYLEILNVNGADLAALNNASVLDSHQQNGIHNILGNIERSWIEGDEILATIRFSQRIETQPTVLDIASGVIRHLSVGYDVAEWQDGVDAAGNRTKTATKWSPREVSFVAVPADPRARTRTRARSGSDVHSGRARSIRELGTRANVEPELIDELIDRNATLDEARAAILDDLMDRSSRPISTTRTHMQNDDPQFHVRAQTDGLLARIEPKHTPSGPGRQYAGYTCADHARACLQRSGSNTTGLGTSELITRALATSDFPSVLLDAINKTLRTAYEAVPSGLKQVGNARTANDFRTQYRVQLDALGLTLDRVSETGEVSYGSLVDAKESFSVDTYAKIVPISRKVLVNDDLGAFSDLSRRLGQAAANFEAQFLVDLLTSGSLLGPLMDDGLRLFHTTHANLAGSGAAVSDTTLGAARLAMRKQVTPGGALVNAVPYALVVPPDIETVAQKTISAIQATAVADTNVWTFLRLIVEPRLSAYSATGWYLFADPALVDGLEYAWLSGLQGPQIESRQGFSVEGLEVKVREDFGAGWSDFRSVYKNPGV